MEQLTLNNGRVIEKITHGNFYKWVPVDGLSLSPEEAKLIDRLDKVYPKWINIKFFIDLYALLREHIEPKSKSAAKLIKNIVKVICRLHGYYWTTGKSECIGTYT